MVRTVTVLLLTCISLFGSPDYAHKERQMQRRDRQMDRALAHKARHPDHATRLAPEGKPHS
jgi:hypothetical protein